MLPKLADLPAEAEQRQRTQRDLEQELAELKRELAKRPQPAPPERVDVPVVKDAQVARLKQLANQLGETGVLLATVGKDLLVALGEAGPDKNPDKVSGSGKVRPPRTIIPTTRRPEVTGGLTGPEQRILNAIAWLEAIGVEDPEQPAVAFLAGYSFGGGAFSNPKGRLRSQGLVEYRGTCIRLTDTGRALAEGPIAPLTVEEMHQRVLARLPRPEQRILQPLLDCYPEPLWKSELAEQADYAPASGAFNNPLGRLRSLGLIAYPQPGQAVALPLLFLEAA